MNSYRLQVTGCKLKRRITRVIAAAVFSIAPATIFAQGLFENAGNDSVSASSASSVTKKAKLLEMNGYVKGAVFGGRDNDNKTIISGNYAQAALKLAAEKAGKGKAFAEVRLNAGTDRGSPYSACDIREAWGSVTPGPLDVKLGRQIIVWGRADAINPTNNITPNDQTALSSEFDDTRMGNELLQVKAKLGKSSIQGIWIPHYRADVLPLSGAKLPSGIAIADPVYPDDRFKNCGYALRLEYNAPSFDGSISYFNGFATLPGFDFSLGQTGLSLIPTAYRMHAVGLDFSTALGSIGVRGEAAMKYPYDDYKKIIYVPHPYAQYVVGLDKSIGNWSVLVQYSGLRVIDYKDIAQPPMPASSDEPSQMVYAQGLASAEIQKLNRLFTGAADKVSHSLTCNIQLNALYETLHLKLSGMYDITTKDYAINPSASYDIADAVNLSVGGRSLDGPDDKLNHLVSNLMSFVYTELKISF